MSWETLTKEEKKAKIQSALSEHVLPMLQQDGGGIELVDFHDTIVTIAYQGACSCCPAALTGTLAFVQRTLQTHLHPSLTVVPKL